MDRHRHRRGTMQVVRMQGREGDRWMYTRVVRETKVRRGGGGGMGGEWVI